MHLLELLMQHMGRQFPELSEAEVRQKIEGTPPAAAAAKPDFSPAPADFQSLDQTNRIRAELDTLRRDGVARQAVVVTKPDSNPLQGHLALNRGTMLAAAQQRCSLCSEYPVRWLHPLDAAMVQYRIYGKGHTLPHFWTLCDRCERLYNRDDEDALVAAMQTSPEHAIWTSSRDVSEHLVQQVHVFRRADLGPFALPN